MIIDFIKSNVNLALSPKRNRLGDLTLGYNRVTHDKNEQVSIEVADSWLEQDVQKARKYVAKWSLDKHEPLVFTAFYVGRRRWNELEPILDSLKNGERVKAAVNLTNKTWFRTNPSLGAVIGNKIIKNEKTL